MPGFGNIGGVWRALRPLKSNIGGAWKTIQQGYGNIGGVQKPLFTNTLVFSNFADTSVFTATRSLKESGRDITSDNANKYTLKVEANRLYARLINCRNDTVRGDIAIKTVNPIDFTNYSKIVIAGGHTHDRYCDYTDEDDGAMSCRRSIRIQVTVLSAAGAVQAKVNKYSSASYRYKSVSDNYTDITLDVSNVKGSHYLACSVSMEGDYKSDGEVEGWITGPITIS